MKDLKEISDSFAKNFEANFLYFLLFIGIILILVAAIILSNKFVSIYKKKASATKLFYDLAAANGLTDSELKVLIKASSGLDDRVLIFLKRTLFEDSVRRLGLNSELAASITQKLYSK